MPDLVVDDVTFRYPGATAPALSNVRLGIGQGEVVLVAGPSGCGKSTLALALCGLVPARVRGHFSGSVHLGGVALSSLQPHQVATQVGMVFQDPASQLITPTVEAEVAFGPENLALARDDISRRVEHALTATGTDRMRRAGTASLSGGEKQRVAIAATLAMRPDVLILDEPCSDLDPGGTQAILAVLRRLNREHGMTIVLVEHRIDEVVPWVNRVVLLDQGRVVLDRPTRDAFDEPRRWNNLGVAVPEMVQLGHALPHVFAGELPLSVEDAYQALAGSPQAQHLAAATRHAPQHPPLHGGDPVISWDNISMRYDGHPVLSGVNLAARPGDWLAVAGPNGSGKTSLVELAMGFRRPTGGTVTLNGYRVDASDVSRQAQQVGYLFQSADTMLFTASVAKELRFALQHRRRTPHQGEWSPRSRFLRRRPRPDHQQRVAQLLDLIGLSERPDADPFSLSAGQRQRLAIAALLVEAPAALILDEPTTGQDEAHAQAILTFLDDLRRDAELTYVMVTHDMRVVARYATRLAVLAGGRILLAGPPAAVFAHREVLSEANLVAPPVADLHSRLVPAGLPSVSLSVPELLTALGVPRLLIPA